MYVAVRRQFTTCKFRRFERCLYTTPLIDLQPTDVSINYSYLQTLASVTNKMKKNAGIDASSICA